MKKQIISAICAVGMLTAVSAGFATVSAATPTEYVLTNNTDDTNYPGMSNLDIGLTYSITSVKPGPYPEVLKNDPNFTKLTNGVKDKSAGGVYAVWGGWQSDNKVEIIADAHTNVYITGADLFAYNAKNGAISYSTDGENYTSLGSVTQTPGTNADKFSVDCDSITARYIKFEIERGSEDNIVLAEIVVRGYLPDYSKILTKNTDDTNYPGMSNLDIGLTYSITSVKPGPYPEVLKNDPNFTKLTNGVKDKSGGGVYAVWGGWQSDNKVEIIADAHTNVYITGADLFAYNAQNGAISYSTDGVNYTSLGSVTQTPGTNADKFSVNCARKLARYIKFEIERGAEDNLVLAEIVVKGYPAAFSFGGTKFDSATSKFSGFLVNAPEVDAVASKVITAVYDADGRFVAAKTANVTVDANSSQSFSADLNGVTIGDGYSIKSYAWNSDNKYLTSPAEYTYTVQ